jgi:hypothetical protein
MINRLSFACGHSNMLGAKHRGAAMPHYRLRRKDDDGADSYWVFAASVLKARTLVALNVSEARAARDTDEFLCEPSQEKMPPANLIYCRLTGPLAIERR